MTEKQLESLFTEFGQVESVSVIKDRQSGRSRGFGFVVMPNDEEANAAIESLNDQDHGGRALRVNQAKERTSRSGGRGSSRGGGRGGYGGGRGGGRRGRY
jgi:RNA recognition motif-containing protein